MSIRESICVILSIGLSCILCLGLLSGCTDTPSPSPDSASAEEAQPTSEPSTLWEDYIGEPIAFGVEAGDVFDEIALDVFESESVAYYSSMIDIFAALENGQIDATISSSAFISTMNEMEGW